MRIRTIKPEFWSNEKLSSLPEITHMFAAALLNYADDEGYFNAHPKLIQAALFPIREPSLSIQCMLNQLSSIGYLRLGKGSDGRIYGHIVNFTAHQNVNRPKPSKIKDLAIFGDDSVIDHYSVTDSSSLEQGTGIRDLDQGRSPPLPPPQAGGGDEEPSSGQPKRSRKKRELSEEAQTVRAEIAKLVGVEYPPATFDALEARFRAKELSLDDALAIVRHLAADRFWAGEVKLAPDTIFRPSKWPRFLAQAKAHVTPKPNVRPIRPEDDDVYARLL